MDMLTLLTLAAETAPQTGDRFPVVPLIIGGVIAAGIAVLSALLAKKNKNDDDE